MTDEMKYLVVIAFALISSLLWILFRDKYLEDRMGEKGRNISKIAEGFYEVYYFYMPFIFLLLGVLYWAFF